MPDKTGTIGNTQGVTESNKPEIKNPKRIRSKLSCCNFFWIVKGDIEIEALLFKFSKGLTVGG